MVWFAPRVRATARSQSVPTPKTQELSLVLTNDAVGAPDTALALAVAPIAPDPFVPEESTPLNAATVMEDATLCARPAVTIAFFNGAVAKARQISASPGCPFARVTSTQARPAPFTVFTVMPPEEVESAEMKANNSSFGEAVEKGGAVTERFAVGLSVDTLVSSANGTEEGAEFTAKVTLALCVKPPLIPTIVRR